MCITITQTTTSNMAQKNTLTAGCTVACKQFVGKQGGYKMIKGKRIKQINNLIIRYNECHQHSVWHNDVCLEDRLTLEQAEEFCKNTKDFIVQRRQQND